MRNRRLKTAISMILLLSLVLLSGNALAGSYSSAISSIHSTFSRQNTYADNIYQQICNGTYRTTEFLEVIACILDK